jgi:peptidoglycan/xylan/chitin deacetylase (PgdA/CDA1 family)
MTSPIALTFDDGPHPKWTPAVCGRLAECEVKATFFVWGEQAVEHADIVLDVLRSGHSVQPHCWAHKSHWCMTQDEISADIDRVVEFLHDVGAPAPHLWRPPWGQLLTGATGAIARQRGLELAGWTIDSTDWKGTSAADMYKIVTDKISEFATKDAVVIMHDSCLEPGQKKQRTDVAQTVDLVRRLIMDNERCFAPMARGLCAALDEQAGRPG